LKTFKKRLSAGGIYIMVLTKRVVNVLNEGELIKTTDNYALVGLRTLGKKVSADYGEKYHTLELVITCKRNPADAYLYYKIHDMKSSAGLMIKEQLKNVYIHKIAYSLEQSLQEVAELEDYIRLLSASIKKMNYTRG
jgi:hypothetical protein